MYCGFVRGSHARLFADVEKGYRFRVMIEEWWKGKVRCGRNEASRQVRKTVQESEQGQGSHVILALTTYSSSIVCAYTEAVSPVDDDIAYRAVHPVIPSRPPFAAFSLSNNATDAPQCIHTSHSSEPGMSQHHVREQQ